jgi:hypothetical protein
VPQNRSETSLATRSSVRQSLLHKRVRPRRPIPLPIVGVVPRPLQHVQVVARHAGASLPGIPSASQESGVGPDNVPTPESEREPAFSGPHRHARVLDSLLRIAPLPAFLRSIPAHQSRRAHSISPPRVAASTIPDQEPRSHSRPAEPSYVAGPAGSRVRPVIAHTFHRPSFFLTSPCLYAGATRPKARGWQEWCRRIHTPGHLGSESTRSVGPEPPTS